MTSLFLYRQTKSRKTMKTTFVKSIILGLFAMASVATVQAEEAGKEAVGKESSAPVKDADYEAAMKELGGVQ